MEPRGGQRTGMVQSDKTLEIKGLASPRTEIITGNILAEMRPGQVLKVVTSDRTAKQKIPALCETLGCTLLDLGEEQGSLYFQIRK
jgi:TusA-related sulfurtransferase